MVAIHPQKIEGRWKYGIALDFHTTNSTPSGYNEAGHMQFETVRPEIAQLLYQLKYRGDQKAAEGIIAAAASYLRPHLAKFEIIIPVPPSTERAVQPVIILGRGIGAGLGVPVLECITTTRSTTQLKDVTIQPSGRSWSPAFMRSLRPTPPARASFCSMTFFDRARP